MGQEGPENDLTVRQLITILKNDLHHLQKRVEKIELQNWGIILAYIAGWIAIIAVEVCK